MNFLSAVNDLPVFVLFLCVMLIRNLIINKRKWKRFKAEMDLNESFLVFLGILTTFKIYLGPSLSLMIFLIILFMMGRAFSIDEKLSLIDNKAFIQRIFLYLFYVYILFAKILTLGNIWFMDLVFLLTGLGFWLTLTTQLRVSKDNFFQICFSDILNLGGILFFISVMFTRYEYLIEINKEIFISTITLILFILGLKIQTINNIKLKFAKEMNPKTFIFIFIALTVGGALC